MKRKYIQEALDKFNLAMERAERAFLKYRKLSAVLKMKKKARQPKQQTTDVS